MISACGADHQRHEPSYPEQPAYPNPARNQRQSAGSALPI